MASSETAFQFFPGQRWVSTTEIDLGLGIITQADSRRVEVLFPAVDEARTYNTNSAPLARVDYPIGEEVVHDEGWSVKITQRHLRNEIIEYTGVTAEGEERIFLETRLSHEIQIHQAKDRLMAAQTDPNAWFEMRYAALSQQEKQSKMSLFGLAGARVDTIKHQLNIAGEVGRRPAPRVLLADEVGLGKTIEAGLIMHYQLLNGLSRRALIVVPETLLHQWLVEMLRRFNLHFTIFDKSRWESSDPENDNPFTSEQLVLTTIEFITSNEDITAKAATAEWDLMVVDEAHHLQWSETEVSKEYAAIEKLAHTTAGVLLLTATPEQLGIASHFARLRLLDPDRFFDLQNFIEEESTYESVATLANKLIEGSAFTAEQIEELAEKVHLSQEELAPLNVQHDGHNELSTTVLNRLIDRHGTSRIFFRNTRAGVKGFPKRCLLPYPFPLPPQYEDAKSSLYPNIGHTDEQWLKEDPRVELIATLLKDRAVNKLVVICAHRETAESLEMYLRLNRGYRSAVFHEGLSLLERDRAAAYFSDMEQGARMLICSEIGSEGRNFQFAHHLMLFDLPQHPDLLEQRIGRLDRIGQKHDIQIHVPYFENSAQENLFRWYHEGLNGFEETSPDGEFVMEQLQLSIDGIATAASDTFETLLADSQKAHQEMKITLQQGRDRLLELNSSGELSPHAWGEEIEELYDSFDLENFLEKTLSCFGVDSEDHSESTWVIKPSDHMVVHAFPSLPDEGVTATFSREQALSREDMEFLTWEHPMIQGIFDLIINNEYGNTTLAVLNNKNVKSGTLFLEAVFRMNVVAPKGLQAHRYLPKQIIRVLTSDGKTDLANNVAHDTLNNQVKKVDHKLAKKLIPQLRKQIEPLFKFCENQANELSESVASESLQLLEADITKELDRLEELKKFNPNVRKEEIEFLYTKSESLRPLLENLQVSLDCIRLIVAA